MDFELNEAQRAIAATAAAALDRSRGGGACHGPTASVAWAELAKAGLLALTLPRSLDGDGLGAGAAGVLLTELGRRAARVPALETIMLGALPVVRWGSEELQERLLSGVAAGRVIMTAGLREQSAPTPAAPATVAVLGSPAGADGPGTAGGLGTVTGSKIGVSFAGESSWILIPATVADRGAGGGDLAVVVVEAAGAGVTRTRTPASADTPEYTVRLDGAPVVGVLPGSAPVDDLYRLAAAGAAAVAAGAVAGALDLTARYVARREQFGRRLATFQAVAQQVADVYITSRTLHLAALSACWRLEYGLDAAEDADVAAYWLATEAPGALRTCHHLHGGIGMDIEYPLHRYYSLVKDLTRFVGGADYRLDRLGAQVAAAGDAPAAWCHAPSGLPATA